MTPAFVLKYWTSKHERYECVYVAGKFINGLEIYFMKDDRPGCPRVFGCDHINEGVINGAEIYFMKDDRPPRPRVFGSDDKRSFPEPYASSLTPVEDVARQALADHGLDFDEFTWEELLEAAG